MKSARTDIPRPVVRTSAPPTPAKSDGALIPISLQFAGILAKVKPHG